MKKGNNILFTLSVIALGLLPFYAFNASALYIKTDDPITIGISGSIGADTYTVNLYKPSSDGTYSISNTVENLSGTTTLDSVITSSSIDLTTPIENKYIFSSSWYSSAELNSTTVTTSTLSTLDGNDGTVDKTVNVYAGYYGYYACAVDGSDVLSDGSSKEILSIDTSGTNDYEKNTYFFRSTVPIGSTRGYIFKKLVGKSDDKVNFVRIDRRNYDNLVTDSGMYRVSLGITNGNPTSSDFERYIRFKPNNKWLTNSASFKYNIHNSNDANNLTWESGIMSLYDSTNNIYEAFIVPWKNQIQFLSFGSNGNQIYYSGLELFRSTGYSSIKFTFKDPNSVDWENTRTPTAYES